MKIVFIAGSNRGKESASEKLASLLMSPADQSLRFEILEIGKYIKVLDENQNFFDSYIRAMHDCDAIIWLVPIRNLLPSYEICRFINIINRKTLVAAQKDPKKYRSLIVRVAGYSAYFVDLTQDLQDDLIARTEHSGM